MNRILFNTFRIFVLGFIVSFGFAPAFNNAVFAQETLRIAAVVNEEVISAYDLLTRIKLIITLSNLPKNNETVSKLKGDTLRSLIDEKLKLQEADKLGITASDDDINFAISTIENRNKMKPGRLPALLESNNIDIETLLMQIRSNIIWPRIVMAKYGVNVDITDEDVEKVLVKTEAAREQPIYLLSEIILPIENISQQDKVLLRTARISSDLQAGASFSALARTFSQSPSAQAGGDIGWLRRDQLSEEIAVAVVNMKPGQTSQPIKLSTSYALVHLRDYRANSRKPKPSPILNLSQVHINLPSDTPQNTVLNYLKAAQDATTGITDCKSFATSAGNISSPMSGNLGDIELAKLPPNLAKAVNMLPIGIPSEPIRTSDAVIVLMVCERRTSPEQEPESLDEKREKIRYQMLNERMDIYARQYIREIRRMAFIDIRQ